jgi:hypothetical protein
MREKASVARIHGLHASNEGLVKVGNLVEVTPDRRVIVDYPQNPIGPTAARLAVTMRSRDLKEVLPVEVLLLFESDDPHLPIVVGIVCDRLLSDDENESFVFRKQKSDLVTLDGDRLVFDARKEVVLRCGKGSITLQSDGKIIVKGTELVSRASRNNKIKGAAVSIN